MIEFLRQTMLFFRYLGLIMADKSGIKKTKHSLLRDYIFLKTLQLLPAFITTKIRRIYFLGYKLFIYDLRTTVALIEAIFIENEYYFNSKKKNPVIVDLGSNIGISIIYFKTLYPNSIIYAYEADFETSQTLSRNIRSFDLRKVTVENLAATDKSGLVDFYTGKDGPGSPLMSTNPQRIAGKRNKVKSIKMSDQKYQHVDFLKMDIEGSELSVLKDLDKNKKLSIYSQLSVEYHHHIDTKRDELSDFLKILEKNNYGYQIHASQNTPFDLKTFEDIQIHAYNKAIS